MPTVAASEGFGVVQPLLVGMEIASDAEPWASSRRLNWRSSSRNYCRGEYRGSNPPLKTYNRPSLCRRLSEDRVDSSPAPWNAPRGKRERLRCVARTLPATLALESKQWQIPQLRRVMGIWATSP